MRAAAENELPRTKGERTAERILDCAEALFAERGFEATSLREIARAAGIREPGLYNHFESKQQLYAAVLERALAPMLEAMQANASQAQAREAHAQLPGVMTDLLQGHPAMAALFQQALQGDGSSIGNQLMRGWLDRLFGRALNTMQEAGVGHADVDRAELAIHIIAMFNLTTGYFLSQRALQSMVDGDITDPANLERQKKLLERFVKVGLNLSPDAARRGST